MLVLVAYFTKTIRCKKSHRIHFISPINQFPVYLAPLTNSLTGSSTVGTDLGGAAEALHSIQGRVLVHPVTQVT